MINTNPKDFKSDKILSLKAAAGKISGLKKKNMAVGLCHGGFDLLHPGHIRHLESASKLCDCLFVSITSDRFVSSRKGSGRPIFSEELRAYSVASLEYVDYAVISDFELATDVLEILKPTYYIKGPDFANKSTPGITAEKNKIKQLGGEIRYTTDQKLSTTDIINYIQKSIRRKNLLIGIDRDGVLIDDVGFLGKNDNWKSQISPKKDVLDFLAYIQAKCSTTKIVVSNQSGVARRYFSAKRVDEINKYVAKLLKKKGIKIDSWQYCPDADAHYAKAKKEINFDPRYVKVKTARKPSPEMILNALKELGRKIEEFDMILVIGNEEDDVLLARNMNARFIGVTGKSYSQLRKEFDSM